MIETCLVIGHYQDLASAIGGLGIQLRNPGDRFLALTGSFDWETSGGSDYCRR